jgi:co-chaperonin GroES (HSP10)
MKLLHDYVAVEPDKPEEKTSSGLLLQEQVKTYPPTGTVRHVASNISDIKAGDRIVYKVYASVDINDGLAIVPLSGVIALL